jgi:hypothetical protein
LKDVPFPLVKVQKKKGRTNKIIQSKAQQKVGIKSLFFGSFAVCNYQQV